MSKATLTGKLEKAAENLRKVSEFFAARQSWPPAADAGSPLSDLAAAAAAMDYSLRRLIDESGAEPLAPAKPAVSELAAGVLDAGRLVTFTTFLRDLDAWFAAQSGQFTAPESVAALRAMEASLGATIQIIATRGAVADPPPVTEPPTTDAAAAEPADEAFVEPARDLPGDGPQTLVLDDTDEVPLVQEFQGIKELTKFCEQQVDDFLAAWAIEYSHYNRKRFLERLLRWISSAPHGQALVLKITTAQGSPEPYPAYVSREILKGGMPNSGSRS